LLLKKDTCNASPKAYQVLAFKNNINLNYYFKVLTVKNILTLVTFAVPLNSELHESYIVKLSILEQYYI